MDKPPPFVMAVAMIKLSLSNVLRSCSSGLVSVFILRGNERSCMDMNPILVIADEGIYLRDQVVYRNVIGDLEQPLKVIVLQHGLLQFHKDQGVFFAGAGVPA